MIISIFTILFTLIYVQLACFLIACPDVCRLETLASRPRTLPHYRPCGDPECELHKSDVDLNYDLNDVQNHKQCIKGIKEVLIPIFVLDGAEQSKTLGRGQWVETLRSDGRGGEVLRGRHQGTTFIGGACHLHKPPIPPNDLRDVADPAISCITVTPDDFPELAMAWFIRDIRQMYPCVDHAATYPFGDLMGLIKYLHPMYWDFAAAQERLPNQSKIQRKAEEEKANKTTPRVFAVAWHDGRGKPLTFPTTEVPPLKFRLQGISYHFKSMRQWMFSPMKSGGKTRLDVFVGALPAGEGTARVRYCMLLLRKLVALHLSPPEVLVETWGLADLNAQCNELLVLGERFAFNYFAAAPAGHSPSWRWPSHWYTAHMHDYHRIIPTSVGRTEGDEWKHHWLETIMATNRKMEISEGVSLLERALTDIEVGTKWRRDHDIRDKRKGIHDFKRVMVKSLCSATQTLTSLTFMQYLWHDFILLLCP